MVNPTRIAGASAPTSLRRRPALLPGVLARLLVSLAVILAGAVPLFGQTEAVTQPPPSITFDDWKKVSANEYTLSFPSAIVSPYPANNRVPLKILLPAKVDGPLPTVLILHYWGATDLKVERALAEQLNRQGVAAVLLTLPYHLERTPPGHRSGELAIEPNPEKLKQTIVQSVLDARRAIDFIVSRPEFSKDRIGLAGTSLGAIVSVLVYAVEPRVSVASFMLGGIDIAGILWSSSRVVAERETLRREGYTLEKLREILQPVEPTNFLPNRAATPTLVIGATYDTVVPREATDKLIAALKAPKVQWLPTGHYGGVFVQRRLLEEIAQFFSEELAGRDYKLAPRISAPTVRLGAQLDTGTGFDIGIGLDLLHFGNGPRGGFASAIVTPRGPHLFLGQRIDKGLSFGVSVGLRRVSGSLFWSTVL